MSKLHILTPLYLIIFPFTMYCWNYVQWQAPAINTAGCLPESIQFNFNFRQIAAFCHLSCLETNVTDLITSLSSFLVQFSIKLLLPFHRLLFFRSSTVKCLPVLERHPYFFQWNKSCHNMVHKTVEISGAVLQDNSIVIYTSLLWLTFPTPIKKKSIPDLFKLNFNLLRFRCWKM